MDGLTAKDKAGYTLDEFNLTFFVVRAFIFLIISGVKLTSFQLL